jgi:hypothetical protein
MRVVLADGESWEQGTVLRTTNALVAVYATGYGASGSSVPQAIRTAIKEIVRAAYDADVDDIADMELPKVAVMLLGPYRILNV